MPRSYRGIILALVGWLILAAGHPEGQAGNSEQNRRGEQIARSLDNISSAIQNGHEASVGNPPCGKDTYESNADLCAQWKAADAAASGASASWLFGIIGCAIGCLTLAAAVAAANYAKKAADAARHSVLSSEKGLRQSDRQSRRELRAYVAISNGNAEWTEDGTPPTIKLKVKNTGQTPAYDVWVCEKMIVSENQPTDVKLVTAESGRVIIGRDGDHSYIITWEEANGAYERSDKQYIYLIGEIRYSDIFKQKWRHHFALRTSLKPGDTALSACNTGNREQRVSK